MTKAWSRLPSDSSKKNIRTLATISSTVTTGAVVRGVSTSRRGSTPSPPSGAAADAVHPHQVGQGPLAHGVAHEDDDVFAGLDELGLQEFALHHLDDVVQAPDLELGDEGAHAPDELDLAGHPLVGGEGHDRRLGPVAGHQPG